MFCPPAPRILQFLVLFFPRTFVRTRTSSRYIPKYRLKYIVLSLSLTPPHPRATIISSLPWLPKQNQKNKKLFSSNFLFRIAEIMRRSSVSFIITEIQNEEKHKITLNKKIYTHSRHIKLWRKKKKYIYIYIYIYYMYRAQKSANAASWRYEFPFLKSSTNCRDSILPSSRINYHQ